MKVVDPNVNSLICTLKISADELGYKIISFSFCIFT